MILISVEVMNRAGSLLTLPLDDVSSGVIVESIEGLDPVKATLVSSSFAQVDGAHYESSRREARNIKMKMSLEPDYGVSSVQALRSRLYEFFMPKSEITLGFRHSDTAYKDFLVHIPAHVETFDCPLFAKDPVADLSVVCYDPDFVDLEEVVHAFQTSSSTSDEAGVLTIEYPGTVETGIQLELLVDRPLTQFTIYHTPPDGTLRTMDFAHDFVADDVLRVSTIVGAKSVIRSRAGVESSVLYALTPQSPWLELQPGTNKIRVYAEGAAIPYNIRYTNKYGGL